jgi:GntR family transcriptional regulator
MPRNSSEPELEMHASEPLYKQVEKRILQCLAQGEWKPGDQLPTESQLAERFGVAVFTIRAGIRELDAANILIRKQGKGTFVARHNRQRQRYQFSRVFREDGAQIFPDRELVSFDRERATDHAMAILGLQKEDRPTVFHIVCLLTVDGRPASTLDITLPAKMFQGLTARAIREGQENLYAVYQDVCGINVIGVQERVYAAAAKGPIARALKIATNSPLLRIERIAYTYDDTPVEFRVRHFDATKYHYRSDERGF